MSLHLALLLSRLPDARECARNVLDTEAVLALAEVHDVVVAVDDYSPAVGALRQAGIPVHVSDKRHIHLPGGEVVDADEALARWLVGHHDQAPFDVLLASAERPALGRVRNALADVPWGVVLGVGPTAHLERLAVDETWMAKHGHELWLAASNAACADLVVSGVDPLSFGLRTRGVPVVSMLHPPVPMLADRVSGELVVVVATGASALEAPEVLEGVASVLEPGPETTVVVIHGPDLADAQPLGPVISAMMPDELARRTVLVGAGNHDAAGAWIEAADALVLLDGTELTIPLVARRSGTVPTVVLEDWDPSATPPNLALKPVAPPAPARVDLLPWTTRDDVERQLRGLQRARDVDMVVLHDADTSDAAAWASRPAISRFDVVVGARSRPPWGLGDHRKLDPRAIALHRRTWSAVIRTLPDVRGPADLVARFSSLAGARSHTLGLLALPASEGTWRAPGRDPRPMSLANGPLVDLRLPQPPSRDARGRTQGRQQPEPVTRGETGGAPAGGSEKARPAGPVFDPATDGAETHLREWASSTRWAARARVALPWRLGLGKAARRGDLPVEVLAWVRQHRIRDRARLAAPWRWGLLRRVMGERW